MQDTSNNILGLITIRKEDNFSSIAIKKCKFCNSEPIAILNKITRYLELYKKCFIHVLVMLCY